MTESKDDASREKHAEDAERPPRMLAFLERHPAYALAAVTAWLFFVCVWYLQFFLKVFDAKVSWFSLDLISLSAAAFNALLFAGLLPGGAILLIASVKASRSDWWAGYVSWLALCGVVVWLLLWIGGAGYAHSIYVVSQLAVVVVWALVPAAVRFGVRKGLREPPAMNAWGIVLAAVLSVLVIHLIALTEAGSLETGLRDAHEKHVAWLESGGEGATPPIATEHIIFSDGHRQLVCRMNETSAWIALEEGDHVIDANVKTIVSPGSGSGN